MFHFEFVGGNCIKFGGVAGFSKTAGSGVGSPKGMFHVNGIGVLGGGYRLGRVAGSGVGSPRGMFQVSGIGGDVSVPPSIPGIWCPMTMVVGTGTKLVSN